MNAKMLHHATRILYMYSMYHYLHMKAFLELVWPQWTA
jgi:hypothetical protein